MTKLTDCVKKRQEIIDQIKALQLDAKEIEQKIKNLKLKLETLNREISK